jgi:hypothetical protein
MRRDLLVLAMVAGGMVVVGCNSDPPQSTISVAQLTALQKQADMYQIDQIEVTWHKAASIKDLDLMMSIWATNATFQVGLATYSGTGQLRSFWSTAAPFLKKNDWVDETPAYKAVITVSGNTGTIYFECHFVDVATSKVVALASTKADVAFIKGRWVITHALSSKPVLSP